MGVSGRRQVPAARVLFEGFYLGCGRPGFNPWVGKIRWRRKWQPTPVFLPRKFHGWMSLVGYSPWGHKELDTTVRLTFLRKYLPNIYIWASLVAQMVKSLPAL